MSTNSPLSGYQNVREHHTILLSRCQRTSQYPFIKNFFVCVMVFNATFNNISAISWRSVLLVEETGESWKKQRPVTSHWQLLPHKVVHLSLIEIPANVTFISQKYKRRILSKHFQSKFNDSFCDESPNIYWELIYPWRPSTRAITSTMASKDKLIPSKCWETRRKNYH
jgi:hypothetical protein